MRQFRQSSSRPGGPFRPAGRSPGPAARPPGAAGLLPGAAVQPPTPAVPSPPPAAQPPPPAAGPPPLAAGPPPPAVHRPGLASLPPPPADPLPGVAVEPPTPASLLPGPANVSFPPEPLLEAGFRESPPPAGADRQRPISWYATGRGSFVPAPIFFRRPLEPLEGRPAFRFVQGNHSLKLSDELTPEAFEGLREADDVVLQALGYPEPILLEDQGGYRDRHGVPSYPSVHGSCFFYDISM